MLTSEQIKSLHKGEYTNSQLSEIFRNHGKANRRVVQFSKQSGLMYQIRNRRQTK